MRTEPHLCEIAKTGRSGEKEQRSAKKEMEGQRKGRLEEIPTDLRHGTRSEILDASNNSRPCTRRWSRKVRKGEKIFSDLQGNDSCHCTDDCILKHAVFASRNQLPRNIIEACFR